MRIGEGLAVRWDDVRIGGDDIWVTVHGTLVEDSGVFYRQTYPKSNKSHRTLPLTNDWIQDMIRRRHRNRRDTEIADLYGDEAAQKQLRHSSSETTRKHYVWRPDVVPDYSSSLKTWLLQGQMNN